MGFSVHTPAANLISIDPQVPEGDVKACCSGATEPAASPPRSELLGSGPSPSRLRTGWNLNVVTFANLLAN